MRNIGVATLILVAVAFAIGAMIGVRSIPDVKRYLEMRRM